MKHGAFLGLVLAAFALMAGCSGLLSSVPHTVIYNGNGNTGGSPPSDSNTYAEGDQIMVRGNTGGLIKTGLFFAGWNTEPDGSGRNGFPQDYFQIADVDVVFYAVWVSNEFEFNPVSGTITGYFGTSENVAIPALIDGVPVVSVGPNAFAGKQLLSVTIPDSVTRIGAYAFFRNSLTEVAIPSGVSTIGAGAFECNRLRNVILPSGITQIESGVFAGNELTVVTIPASVSVIGYGAFNGNNLRSVIISTGVSEIGGDAFANNMLGSLVIPDSVTIVGSGAFRSNQLTLVVISAHTVSIESYAFSDNTLESVVIPEGVRAVGYGAFAGNPIVNIAIGKGVDIKKNEYSDYYTAYAMGKYGKSFEIFYDGAGKEAGTYAYELGFWEVTP